MDIQIKIHGNTFGKKECNNALAVPDIQQFLKSICLYLKQGKKRIRADAKGIITFNKLMIWSVVKLMDCSEGILVLLSFLMVCKQIIKRKAVISKRKCA